MVLQLSGWEAPCNNRYGMHVWMGIVDSCRFHTHLVSLSWVLVASTPVGPTCLTFLNVFILITFPPAGGRAVPFSPWENGDAERLNV